MVTPALGSDWSEPAFPDDAIEVGRIIGAYGIKGWVRVHAHAADPKALFSSRRWFLLPPEPQAGSRPRPAGAAVVALPPLLRITQSRSQGDDVVAAAQEVPDRNAAEALKGARVFVGRASFPTPDDGEFYWVDLIGLTVINREGETLGTVSGLLETGAHSVLRVARPDAAPDARGDDAERLVPFVAAFIDDVDLQARRIAVDWGLDY